MINFTFKLGEREFHLLASLGERIMATLEQFLADQQTFNDSISKAADDILTIVNNLNAQIAALQSSPTISTADQAAIDALDANGQALVTKVQALDTLTPPAAPTT